MRSSSHLYPRWKSGNWISPERVHFRYSPSSYIGVRKPISVVPFIEVERTLRTGCRCVRSCGIGYLWPTGDPSVEAQRVFGPAVALRDAKQQVRQLFDEVSIDSTVGAAQ